jgi:diguanylate cyclase (GGDEF)-like protein
MTDVIRSSGSAGRKLPIAAVSMFRSFSLRTRLSLAALAMVCVVAAVLVAAWLSFLELKRATALADHSQAMQMAGENLLRNVGDAMLSEGSKSTRDGAQAAMAAIESEIPAVAAGDAHAELTRASQQLPAIRRDLEALLQRRQIGLQDEQSQIQYGRLIATVGELLPSMNDAHERARQGAADSLHRAGVIMLGGLLALMLLSAAAGAAVVHTLDRELGGDPSVAHQLSARIAEGELDTPVRFSHPHSVLASLENVRVRLLERRTIEQRVQYLARHDTLSGALNRAHFNELLSLSIEQSRREGQFMGLLYIDLDRFKEVNDSLGHAHGDEVIRISAQRLRELLRHGDHLARLGGDEFAVLALGVREVADLERLAQRVNAVLSEPMRLANQQVQIGASVGVAILDATVADRGDLLHRADLAMYRAKAAGRGGFSVYDEQLDGQLRDRRDMVRDLRAAVGTEQVFLEYQPIFARDGQTLRGYEALLRWRHPQRGMVGPDVFVPLAEDAGIIDTLGRWVMRQACADAAQWAPHLSVAVNLSVAQLEASDLTASIAAALDLANLAAERLHVEITESMLMSHREQTMRAFEALAALGVGIVIDDFGTGYSSLAYLWRFSFNKLKIDRSFIADLHPDTRVHTVVRSIISLAHALGMKVTAEGVERREQLTLLQSEDCDEMQGYLLGKPAAAPRHQSEQVLA